MTDAELRGRLLSHFYNLRHNSGGYVPVSDMILSGTERVTLEAIGGVCRQLGEAGLIEWTGYLGRGPEIGSARITGLGVDAVERGNSASLAIRFPNVEPRDLPAALPTTQEPVAGDGISQEGRKARFEIWEKLGVDRVKADLANGGHQTIGGPPQVLELAWEWVRMKESEAARAGPAYTLEAAKAVYAAIEGLATARKRACSLTVPLEAERILVASGRGRSTTGDAHTEIRAAIVGLTNVGKIEAHADPNKDWLIRESLEPELEKVTAQIPKIFIVHGHDNEAKAEVARFVERLGFRPIILHEQASQNRTVIEKFEANSDVGFAVVLLTPDDEGSKKGQPAKPRARQNVVLELGYFVGRLGREKVCALRRGEVEIPSDFNGVVYETYDEHGAWKGKLAKELEAANFAINWAKVHA